MSLGGEKKGIAGELERGFAGEPWHGPSVTSVLRGMTAAEAAARPLAGAHSIWEIVLHMTGWTREVARRLHGGEPALPAAGDWPEPPAAGDPTLELAWERTVATLAEAHREVLAALDAFPEERLREQVGLAWPDLPLGTGVPYRVMLHGLAQHYAYHAGQIAVLRKGTRPQTGSLVRPAAEDPEERNGPMQPLEATPAPPDSETLRYPTGRFRRPGRLSGAERADAIAAIAATPAALSAAVLGLTDEQLDTPYRPGGWTVRQVVHHVPESHMNAYLRFKLAMTEDNPTIRPYLESRWSEQPEVRGLPPAMSLALLEILHERWLAALRATPEEAFARPLNHPESGPMTIDDLLAMYAWHGRHHVAHVTELRRRMSW